MADSEGEKDYPPRLYGEGKSPLENKSININCQLGQFTYIREAVGQDVWDSMKELPVGIVAKLVDSRFVWSGKTVHYLLCRQLEVHRNEIWCLVGGQPIRFSLHEFGEITGLNIDPLPTTVYEPKNSTFWTELNVSGIEGPKYDELKPALEVCRSWPFEKRKWLGLLLLLSIGLYGCPHNSRIPFESAKRVFDDEAMMTYPWGRAAYEYLVQSIKLLNPSGKSYYLSGFVPALLVWAYESIFVFREKFTKLIDPEAIPLLRFGPTRTRADLGKVISDEIEASGELRVRNMIMKEGDEIFCNDEAEDPRLVKLIVDLQLGTFVQGFWDVKRNEKKIKKKMKKVKRTSSPEMESDDEGKQERREKKKRRDDETNDDLSMTVHGVEEQWSDQQGMGALVRLVENLGSKFDSFNGRFENLEVVVGNMEKGIGDRVIAAVDEKYNPRLTNVEDIVEQLRNEIMEMKERYVAGEMGQNENYSKVAAAPSPMKRQPSVNSPPQSKTPAKSPAKTPAAKTPAKTPVETPAKTPAKQPTNSPLEPTKSPPQPIKRPSNTERKRRISGVVRNLVDIDEEEEASLLLASFIEQSPAKVQAGQGGRGRGRGRGRRTTRSAAAKKEEAELKKQDRQRHANEKKAEKERQLAEKKRKKEEEKQDKEKETNRIRIKIPKNNTEEVGAKVDCDVVDVTDEICQQENELLPSSDESEEEKIRTSRIQEYYKLLKLAPDGKPENNKLPPNVKRYPYIGDDGLSCMRKNCQPSAGIYDPLEPVDPHKLEALYKYIEPYKACPLERAPPEIEFYRVIITERKFWPKPPNNYGWLSDVQTSAYLRLLRYRYLREPCPFHNTRIAFVDQWFTALWAMHYNMFKMNPKLFDFDKGGYKDLFDGKIPIDQPTDMKWFDDVDHLYMIVQVKGDHWVCLHVDLLGEKIDCYDCIIGEGTKESDNKIHDYCRPYCCMIPEMLNRFVAAEKRRKTFKQFGFRRRKRNIPQNVQVGDCGVYAVKFAECLALGVTFEGINDENIQVIRLKMAAEILDEAPDFLAQFS